MDIVQLIIIVILIAICPRKGTFVNQFKFKLSLRGLECNMSTKEKSAPHIQSEHSNSKN